MPLRQFTCLHCGTPFSSDQTLQSIAAIAAIGFREHFRSASVLHAAACLRHAMKRWSLCSRACAGILRSARGRRLVACEICGKQQSVAKSKLSARYCSRACKHLAQTRRLQKPCAYCKKLMDLRPSEASRKFCDIVCKYAVLLDESGTSRFGPKNGRGTFACQECGRISDVHRYDAEHRRFCSSECCLRQQARVNAAPQVALACLWCGVTYQRPQSYVRHNSRRPKFCSRECNGAYTARYKQNRVSGTEKQFLDRLESCGLRFTRQVRVKHFVVDALCTSQNVVIEFDGEYWHSLEHIKRKDERKSIAVASAGYRLIRVPERSWLDDPEATIRNVLKEVGHE